MLFNRRYTLLWLAAFAADILTKQWALHALSEVKIVSIWWPWIYLRLVSNPGAAFGILYNALWLLIGIGLTVLIGGFYFQKKLGASDLSRLGITMVLAGAAGNTLDRLLWGHVVDFLYVWPFPIFNLADIWIDIGVFCLITEWGFSPAAKPAKKK